MRVNPVKFIGEFTQLPNGDLWKPPVKGVERVDNVSATPEIVDAADAVSQILAMAPPGEALTCPWCGMQYSRKQLNELGEHIDKQHQHALGNANANDAALELAAAEGLAKADK